MFGRVLSLVKWAVIAALALTIGAQLLRSASLVVLSLRSGDPLPFILVAGLSFGLQWASGHDSGVHRKPGVTSVLLDVVAYSSTLYLFIVVFLAASLYGIVAAIACSGFAILATQLVKRPVQARRAALSFSRASSRLGFGLVLPGAASTSPMQMWQSISHSRLRVIRIPDDARSTIIDILKERPLLPLSLSRLEDALFLVVNVRNGQDWVPRILELLEQAGVRGAEPASPLLQEAVLGLPLIESAHGLALSEYVIADKSAADRLVGTWPNRMTVYSDTNGLRVIVRAMDAAGMSIQRIPRGSELSVVVEREFPSHVEAVADSEA